MSEPTAVSHNYRSTKTMCQQYDVTPVTIWRWVKNGRLRAPRKINGKNRWEEDAEPIFDDEIEGESA